MNPGEASEATRLLTRLRAGDAHAADELTPLVYEELRGMAKRLLAAENKAHTLQPTALVHEAYVKLIDQRNITGDDRAAFMGIAATIMRRVLVDHARAKKRLKRGGSGRRVDLEATEAADRLASTDDQIAGEDIESLDAALTRLADMDPRKARLVELRFFAGMSEGDAADIVGISRATASREWRMARAWLARELSTGQGEDDRA